MPPFEPLIRPWQGAGRKPAYRELLEHAPVTVEVFRHGAIEQLVQRVTLSGQRVAVQAVRPKDQPGSAIHVDLSRHTTFGEATSRLASQGCDGRRIVAEHVPQQQA